MKTATHSNANSSSNTTASIDRIIAARKVQLPIIQAERDRVVRQISALGSLQAKLGGLLSACTDETVGAEAGEAREALAESVSELEGCRASLDELEAEFTRDTLNIGVSGAARTGKSTTLQHITGLTDRQIPSGGMNPVTAVRSEIFNSPRNEAVITFKSERDFIEGYVRPHVANVNGFLPDAGKLSVGSLAALKAAELPEKLEGAPSVAATDSLKRLREAKRSASSYEGYLGASPATVPLDDVSRYVTYPAPGAEQLEAQGGPAADRRYLAVELAQVYCRFPNLGDARVGLVDLPGLGEIGNSASDIHLKGLEDRVDQVFLVMMPSDKKAFADHELARNLDQLRVIQPAVEQGDLVVCGINRDAGVSQDAVDNMRSHFEAEINAGRPDPYDLVDYCAIDDADVSRMFSGLLDRMARLLPEMDRRKVEHCMGAADLSTRVAEAAERIVRSMDRVLRSVPSTDRVMKQRIDAIERSIIGQLSAYAVELSDAASSDSEVFKDFIADAERIHGEVSARIADGLFRSSQGEWDDLASGSKDYYNLYRDECKRIRYEIIDAYCGLDRFYGVHVSNFKLRVLDTVLRACGMDGYFAFGPGDDADLRIGKVASELGSTLRDDDLDSALSLLASVKFDFRSNVFLQIEGHLSELANPHESMKVKGGYKAEIVNKRAELGGAGPAARKREKLAEYLRNDATAANDAILAALKGEQDRFNRYLAVSIDFFNNYLFGKDEDNFKQVVIRGLIREYKKWVLPDADDASKSPLGRMALEVKEAALALGSATPNVPPKQVARISASQAGMTADGGPRKRAAKSVDAFRVGQVLSGSVSYVKEGGAYVNVPGHRGFVPKGEISRSWVDDAREFVRKGQDVTVKVIDIDRSRNSLLLSMKRCG